MPHEIPDAMIEEVARWAFDCSALGNWSTADDLTKESWRESARANIARHWPDSTSTTN